MSRSSRMKYLRLSMAALPGIPEQPLKTKPVISLSGLVKCASCGGRMNRNVSNGHARYRCMTRIFAPEKCQCPSVKEALLEEAVFASGARTNSGVGRREGSD